MDAAPPLYTRGVTLPPPLGESDAPAHAPVAAYSALSSEPGLVPIATDHLWLPPAERGTRARSIVGWSVGLSLAVVAITAGALIHTNANLSFDEALVAAQEATVEARDANEEAARVAAEAAAEVEASESIVAVAADDLVDPAARTALADATAASSTALSAAQILLEQSIREPDDTKPLWTWELFDSVPGLEAQAESLDELADDLTAVQTVIDEAGEQLDVAASALYASIAPAADALEAANVSARNAAVIEFRRASDAAAEQTALSSGAPTFAEYVAKAAELEASAQAQLEAKSGPLYRARLEVEAYARSIAGGVLLEFDWAPYVNGVGGRTGISGTATWNTGNGGFSTITLSNSVAEIWPTAPAKALVAHEVGHAITSKCHEMFDSANQAANEAWATAWAISMGHTNDGNGVQAYGYPPQDLIATAATCR